MNPLNFVLIIILLSLTTCQTNQITDVNDSFESDTLSKIWSGDKLPPGTFKIQSDVVKSGRKAAMITLCSGDQIEEEKGTELERAELKESKKLISTENSIYAYSFSLFMSADFPVTPTRLVIAQWKQDCKSGNCDPNNPVIALRYGSGEFKITLQTGPDKTTLYSQTESILNKWMDFSFHIKFSRKQDGQIRVWLNEKEIVNFEGITAYSQVYGYPDPGSFYFKMGLYRDHMVQPMTIYIDDYKKQQLSE